MLATVAYCSASGGGAQVLSTRASAAPIAPGLVRVRGLPPPSRSPVRFLQFPSQVQLRKGAGSSVGRGQKPCSYSNICKYPLPSLARNGAESQGASCLLGVSSPQWASAGPSGKAPLASLVEG